MRSTTLRATLALLIGIAVAGSGLSPKLSAPFDVAPDSALAVDATVTACDETSFDDALAAVQPSGRGTITIACAGTITFTSEKSISSAVRILGNGSVVFDGTFGPGPDDKTRLFSVQPGGRLQLDNLTLRNAGDAFGGAIEIFGGATVVIRSCTLSGNQASVAGGAILNAGELVVSDSTFSDNQAIDGGAIFNFGSPATATITASTFDLNLASNIGGAIHNQFGSLTVIASSFTGNTATVNGGAIHTSGQPTMSSAVIASNFSTNSAANSGGAIFQESGDLTITAGSFSSNTAGVAGGAILNFDGALAITAVSFSGNGAQLGGAIHLTSNTASIVASTFTSNTATSDGGAIRNGANLVISASTFSSNIATSSSGAIRNFGPLVIASSTFTGNSAGIGGAIQNTSTLTMTSSTLNGNSATTEGGALFNNSAFTTTITSSIIAGNNAPAEPNCSAISSITSGGANLSDDASCDFDLASDIQNSAAINLAALADNGGPTQTMLPQTGSDAIDNADCALTIDPDQRGVDRPDPGATCDIGAVETTGTVPVQLIVAYNATGAVDESDDATIEVIAYGPAGAPLDYAFDCDDNGSYEALNSGSANLGSAACIFDDDGTFTVGVQVCDAGDPTNCDTGTASVTVFNLAPKITGVANDGAIDEGGSANITVDAKDPAGVNDPLQYEFDCDNDGVYDIGPQPADSASCTFNDNGNFTVGVRVSDEPLWLTTGSTIVPVNNVAPTVQTPTVDPSPSNEGQSIVASASFSDPGTLDTHECTVDYGDGSGAQPGTVDQTADTCTGPAHTYLDDTPSGTASDDSTITVTVSDDDAGSNNNTATQTVTNLPPVIVTITTNAPVPQGQPVTITVDATDAGGAGDPLTYAFDCDDSGDYETAGAGNQGECNLDPSAVSSTVGVQVTDDDLGVTAGAVAVGQTLTLCASVTTGQLSEPMASGACLGGSLALVLPGPTVQAICINAYTGQLYWLGGRPCPATWLTHLVPGDGPLHYCRNLYTGKLRVSFPGQCQAYERAGVIPG